jgi:hypothetical protein
MASLLRVDAVPRRVVAATRQPAQPSAHPLDGHGNQAVASMLAARRRTLARVIDASTVERLDDFQTLVGPDEIGEIGASLMGVMSSVATYLASKGDDAAADAIALKEISVGAEALETLAIRMREDRSEHRTDRANATPLGSSSCSRCSSSATRTRRWRRSARRRTRRASATAT